MKEQELKTFKIFSKDIALELIVKGNTYLYPEENRKKPWLKVFLFLETDKLHRDLTEIDRRNKANKN